MSDNLTLGRRSFLKLGGDAVFLSLVMGTGMATFTRPAFAGDIKVLDNTEQLALLSMSRTLFPHDFIPDGYYMNAVAAIDEKCADAKTREQVAAGVSILNGALGKPFNTGSEAERESVLQSIEKSDFFQLVYNDTLNNLYGNKEVWRMFGYEGSSVEKGGYLERGFDDIEWLPKA